MNYALATALALTTITAPALAQEEPTATRSLYLRASGLWSDQQKADYDETGFPTMDVTFDSGWGGTLAFGHTFDAGIPLSLELEGSFRTNDLDELQTDFGDFDIRGDLDTITVMVNFVADVPLGDSPLSLYAGGGIGMAYSDVSVSRVAGIAVDLDGDDWTFAWQVMGGVRYAFSDRVQLYSGVRWLDAGTADYGDAELELKNLAVEVGLRVYF